MNKRLLFGILAVAGAWLIDLAFGYIYTSGFSMPLGGFLEKKIGFRLVIALSCVLQCSALFLSYFTIKHSFITLLMTYGLLLGGGTGFGYSVVLASAAVCFPNRRGLIVGIIVAGFGLGGLVFTPIQTSLINPDNVAVNNETRQFTDEVVLDRIPNAFLILGGILLSIEIVGFILLQLRPNVEPKGMITNTNIAEGSNEIDLPIKELLKCCPFYLLWLIMFLCIIPITIIHSAFKLYGQQHISDDRFLSLIATVAAIFNSGGRIFWGALVDHFSFKVPMCFMFLSWSVVLISFPHLHLIGGTGLLVSYTIWVFLLFFSFSGVFALMPAAVGSVFGHKNLAVNYGMIFSAFAFGAVLCALLVSILHSKDSYLMQFTGCGITNLIALFILLWVEDRNIPVRFKWLNKLSGLCRSRHHQHATEEIKMNDTTAPSKLDTDPL